MSQSFIDRTRQSQRGDSGGYDSPLRKVDHTAQMKWLDSIINADDSAEEARNNRFAAQLFARDEEEEKEKQAMPDEEFRLKPQKEKERQAKCGEGNPGTKTNMPDDVQDKMENSFGEDFSDVNIHKDSEQAPSLGALAYTQGNDIHFAPGQYDPASQKGQELLGHELSHVVQQREGRVKPDGQQNKADANVNTDEGLEKEAGEQGKQAAQGKMTDVKGKGSGVQMQANNTEYDDWTEQELKAQILAFLQTICEIKQEYLNTWFDNSKEEDTKWGAVIVESVISMTLSALTAGVAGVISAHVTRNLAGLVQEEIKSIAGSIIQDLLKIGTAHVQKAAANGLASSSVSLEGKFKNAAWTQFNMEKDAHQTQAIHPDDSQYSSKDVLVAATQALEKTRDDLYKDGTAIMQQLTIGYLNFQDNSYIANKAGVTENDNELQRDEKIDNYKENNRDVVEYGARMGRLHFKGEVKGSPDNPTLLIDVGNYSKMNRSTANVLKGMNFSELGSVTMSFYLDAKDCDWSWLTGDIGRRAPITFEVGPQGIFVDQDRNGDVDNHVYREGAEWLANYYCGETPSENNLLYFADKGAKKLFNNLVKTKAVPELEPSDLF